MNDNTNDRYFLDHGMINDRVTGKHVTTDDTLQRGGTLEVLTLLSEYEQKLAGFYNQTPYRYEVLNKDGQVILSLVKKEDADNYKERGYTVFPVYREPKPIQDKLELNDPLKAILGRPNFACAGIATALRLNGQNIPHKAEEEQAAVIHWMLMHYFKHGAEMWDKVADEELQSIKEREKKKRATDIQGKKTKRIKHEFAGRKRCRKAY